MGKSLFFSELTIVMDPFNKMDKQVSRSVGRSAELLLQLCAFQNSEHIHPPYWEFHSNAWFYRI